MLLILDMDLKTLVKMIGPVSVLNLILPTADIVSDLLTVVKLYVGEYGCYPSDLIYKQFQVCLNSPLKYCTTNTSGEYEYQHAWCKLEEDNETYTCDGYFDLWVSCLTDPRGFNEDPENINGISHGVLRHPKFATMLLGKLQIL